MALGVALFVYWMIELYRYKKNDIIEWRKGYFKSVFGEIY
jgi:hypothetical protein